MNKNTFVNQNKNQIVAFKKSDIPKIRELYKLASQKTKPQKISELAETIRDYQNQIENEIHNEQIESLSLYEREKEDFLTDFWYSSSIRH